MGNKQKINNTCEIIEKKIFTKIPCQEILTVLDLSNRDVSHIGENIILPQSLTVLNIAHNKLKDVPPTVLKLNNLKKLNLSHNAIELFDDTPNFCHTLESLDLSNNNLYKPPSWVWTKKPKNLVQLNLSCNNNMCQSLVKYYFEDILQYTTVVKRIDLYDCSLGKHMKLISTFRHAEVVNLGNDSDDYNYLSVNHIENVPCVGLEDCFEIRVLNLCKTHIYNIQHNIDMYQHLIELNLSQNNINSLPDEFCNLKNLEVCILSFNKILYLPEDMYKLDKLRKLYLDNNTLCMIPEKFSQLKRLKMLDLYSNHLYEGANDIENLERYDFAQNYSDEPSDEEYLKKKQRLRKSCTGRLDGRAPEEVYEDSETYDLTDCDSDSENVTQEELPKESTHSRCSSPEDWDSDDFWVPSPISNQNTPRLYKRSNSISPMAMQWLEYVQRKMAEGNFCPMDMHLAVSITEKVKHERMCNPNPQYESDGQFDDYSDDDS